MSKTRILGRTGLEVAEIGFGAWPIGGRYYGHVTEDDAHACVNAYVEGGGNFIDTARRYLDSERIIGEYFRRHGGREGTIIASKTHQTDALAIRKELEETLRMLQSDYVDVYYLHAPPDDPTEMKCVLDVYERLKEEGKIRAIGASIKGPNVTERTVALCRQYIRSGRVDVLQVIYSVFRQKNSEMFREASEGGVGVVGRTVLESGFLTGKYAPGHQFTGDDHRRRWGGERLAGMLEYVQELEELAVAPPYRAVGDVAIRFALDQEGISTIIVGAKSVPQVQANMRAASLPPVTQELRERLIGAYGGLIDLFNAGD